MLAGGFKQQRSRTKACRDEDQPEEGEEVNGRSPMGAPQREWRSACCSPSASARPGSGPSRLQPRGQDEAEDSRERVEGMGGSGRDGTLRREPGSVLNART